jgi:Uncharacterized protein conserved in bacteria
MRLRHRGGLYAELFADGLLDAEPEKFFITAHYSGYPGMLVRLSAIDPDELSELLTESWRLTAPKRLLAQFDAEHR